MLIERLQAELRQQAGGGQQRRTGCRSRSSRAQAAQHDEGEQRDDEQADDQAEFLAGHREDEIGMGVGQHVLTVPSPGPRPNRPAVDEASSERSTW